MHNVVEFDTIDCMNTVAIYIKTQPELKAKAQKIAKTKRLRQFVRTKSVTFRAGEERPSEYLIESLKKSEEDIKAGRVTSFDSGEKAVKYFESLEENE